MEIAPNFKELPLKRLYSSWEWSEQLIDWGAVQKTKSLFLQCKMLCSINPDLLLQPVARVVVRIYHHIAASLLQSQYIKP